MTKKGVGILALIRTQVRELYREVVEEARKHRGLMAQPVSTVAKRRPSG